MSGQQEQQEQKEQQEQQEKEGVVLNLHYLSDTPDSSLLSFLQTVPWLCVKCDASDCVDASTNIVLVHNLSSLELLSKLPTNGSFKIWVYSEQTSIHQIPQNADRVFCVSKEWKEILRSQGFTKPIDILSPGFDRERFLNITREEARHTMNIPNESFLIVPASPNTVTNTYHYDILIMAFVELIVANPTEPIFLMCVCDKTNLFEIYSRELTLKGVNVEDYSKRLIVCCEWNRLTDEERGVFYKVADCGVSCAESSVGHDVSIFEQMGLGVPCVVSNTACHRIMCSSTNSILVEPTFRCYKNASEIQLVEPKAVSKALEKYVQNKELRLEHGRAAQKTIEAFTWPSVTKGLVKRLGLYREELSLDLE